jgi:signal transduction histidine kinase
MEVRDDGCGMPADKMSAHTQGQRGMLERARRIGAELRVESAPGAGVQVQMTGKI